MGKLMPASWSSVPLLVWTTAVFEEYEVELATLARDWANALPNASVATGQSVKCRKKKKHPAPARTAAGWGCFFLNVKTVDGGQEWPNHKISAQANARGHVRLPEPAMHLQQHRFQLLLLRHQIFMIYLMTNFPSLMQRDIKNAYY